MLPLKVYFLVLNGNMHVRFRKLKAFWSRKTMLAVLHVNNTFIELLVTFIIIRILYDNKSDVLVLPVGLRI